jgi:hypothetical protein
MGRQAVNDAAPATASNQRCPTSFCLLFTAIAGLTNAALGLVSAIPASAQADRPIVSIAATVSAEPATQAPFPIRIGPPSSIPRDSFVKVRGLPPMAALSDGHVIAPGSWAIALNALPNLKILVPSGVTGTADIVVALVGLDGAVLAEARSTLVVRGTAAAPKLLLPERREPALTPQDKLRAVGFVKRGDDLLAAGNVEAARLFYERAADAGLAQGALALAATYDPDELARRQVVGGLQSDPVAARRWYERARELGADEADEPLRRLSARQR